MWGSFYLGSVLNCDYILQFFLGDLSAQGKPSQSPSNVTEGQELNLKKETYSASKKFLDPSAISSKISIDPADGTISGEGRVYGLIPISQNKLYFEVHVVQSGEIRVGVGVKGKEQLEDPLTSWAAEFGTVGTAVEPGDIIGVAFDQSNFANLSYYLNGIKLSTQIEGIKGSTLYTALSLKDGAKVKVAFDQGEFKKEIPSGFMHFVEEISLI